MRNIRSYNKLNRMPLLELFFQNPTLLALPSEDFTNLVVTRCQHELETTESNYFVLKKIVLSMPVNELNNMDLVEISKNAWINSNERKIIKALSQ